MADNLLSNDMDYSFSHFPPNRLSSLLLFLPLNGTSDEIFPGIKLHDESYICFGTPLIGFLLPSALCLLCLGALCVNGLHRMVISGGIRIYMRILRTLVLRGSSDIHYDMYHSEYEKDECQRPIMVSVPSNI